MTMEMLLGRFWDINTPEARGRNAPRGLAQPCTALSEYLHIHLLKYP